MVSVDRGPQLDGDTSDDSDDGGGGDARPGPSSGHGKPKTAQQKKGETVMKKMVSELNGESYSFRYLYGCHNTSKYANHSHPVMVTKDAIN